MFHALPGELIVGYILPRLHFDEVCACRVVCRAWRALLRDQDWAIAQWYARVVLEDEAFWTRASARPTATSQPRATWHAEIVRIEAFQSVMRKRLTARDLYSLWRHLDRLDA